MESFVIYQSFIMLCTDVCPGNHHLKFAYSLFSCRNFKGFLPPEHTFRFLIHLEFTAIQGLAEVTLV